MKPGQIGLIGCGAISAAYLDAAKRLPGIEISACADLDMDRARAQAQQFKIPRVLSVDELLRDDAIEIVLNLTVPKAHVPVALRALEAGKHTYAEKPLGINRDEGRKLVDAAKTAGKLIGCAPDTFLGTGQQTARKLIDEGAIGQPVAFTANMMCRGHEHWHPNPEFYYEAGGGPMFDMGPYYLTALLHLFGPVKRMMGMASKTRPERTITHKDREGKPMPKFGKVMPVEIEDHIVGSIEFQSGVVGTLITSFATAHATYDGQQPITVYGATGTMRVPDPNQFDGKVHVRGWDDAEWTEAQTTFVKGYGRGVGLADMAQAVRADRPFRCNGDGAMAVLDLMQGFLDSSKSGQAFMPTVSYQRPAPMPEGGEYGVLQS